jgi:hypothetical protein
MKSRVFSTTGKLKVHSPQSRREPGVFAGMVLRRAAFNYRHEKEKDNKQERPNERATD